MMLLKVVLAMMKFSDLKETTKSKAVKVKTKFMAVQEMII